MLVETEKRYQEALEWLSAADEGWWGTGDAPEPDGGLLHMIAALREVMSRHPETRDTIYLLLDVEHWKKREKTKGHNEPKRL